MIKVPKTKYDLGDYVQVCTKRWSSPCYIVKIIIKGDVVEYKMNNHEVVQESDISWVIRKCNLPY